MNMNRKEADQKFLNSLIQGTSREELDWHCEQEDSNPQSYRCVFPKRIQIGTDPKNLRAVDLILYPVHLVVIDAWDFEHGTGLAAPILQFNQEDYPTHIERLIELAENQRIVKNDERYVTLLSGFLKGQN